MNLKEKKTQLQFYICIFNVYLSHDSVHEIHPDSTYLRVLVSHFYRETQADQ